MVLTDLALALLGGCTGPKELIATPLGGADLKSETKAAWQPGDEIPGWEVYEYDCPLTLEGGAAVVNFPDAWTNLLILNNARGTLEMTTSLVITDCGDAPCEGSTSTPTTLPSVKVAGKDLDATDVLHKSGYYGQTADRPGSVLLAIGSLPVGSFTDGYPDIMQLAYCLSRVRPDELRGVFYITYLSGALPHDYYEDALVQYPFELPFQGSFDYNYALPTPPTDDFFEHVVGYNGTINYDSAWDWAAITDPDVRDAVYDQYRPYNLP